MKYLIILLSAISLISCKNIEEDSLGIESVSIKILNDSIFYLKRDSLPKWELSSHYNNLEIFRARNIIQYELKNNTTKKQLILINPFSPSILGDYLSSDTLSGMEVYYLLTDKNNNFVRMNIDDYNIENWDFIEILKSKKKIKKLQENMQIDSVFRQRYVMENSFVLNPKESKMFSFKLDLPIIKEPFVETDFEISSFLIFNDVYYFQLFYGMSNENVTELFTSKELEDLKNNKIEVFTGQIKSNKIKVVPW